MLTKSLIKKTMAMVCMAGMALITNAPLVYAYEVHVMNVVANIVDDSITISPSGNNFCNDGSFKVELKTSLSGAAIYYTIDGSDPVCGKNGNLYSAPFALTSSKTVKAVSCHGDIQSLPMSRSYTVSYDYCDHTSIKINKVYYYTDQKHSASSCPLNNEWVELYNPTNAAVNIKGWKICDGQGCDVLSSGNLSISAKGYAIVTVKDTTWQFWNIPSGTMKIALGNAIGGDAFSNTSDMVAIKDANGNLIDQANWGTPSASWANYNPGLWNPGARAVAEGQIFGRVNNGVDTDKLSDWTIYSIPTVTVAYPNGGEKWSVGSTYTIKWNASDNKSSLSIDLYYSNDAGSTWGVIAKNVSNSGSYGWKIPAKIASAANGSDYSTVSSGKAIVKVMATDYAKNFMLSNWDNSDKNFCLSGCSKTVGISANTLTAEDANDADSGSGSGSTESVKSSEMKNEEGEDYLLSDSTVEKDTNKDGNGDSGSSAASTESAASAETLSGTDEVEGKDTAGSGATSVSTTVSTDVLNSAKTASDSEVAGSADEGKNAVSSQNSGVGSETSQMAETADSSSMSIAADKDATALEFNLNA